MQLGTFETKIDYPDTNKLDRECKWILPAFESVDGFGEEELWILKGLIVAIGFIDDDKQRIIGSGVMVAPGLCLTATHVIDETKRKQAFLYTFPNKSSMRIWLPVEYHAVQKVTDSLPHMKPQERFSDVSILSYLPFSKFNDDNAYLYTPVEVALPKIGERLWAVGYREVSNDGTPQISFFVTSGLVTEQYPEGRGAHISGACIEIAMKALGGMSGGPVFNEAGRVIGVISTCLEGHSDNKGPTYATLVWPSLVSTVYTPWPENHWPNLIAGLQVEAKENGARVSGKATREKGGVLSLKFSKQDIDEIHQIFKDAGVDEAHENDDIYDYIYELFEDILEYEGLKYLGSLNQDDLNKSLTKSKYSDSIKLFQSIDAETMEGLEDIEVKSVTLLESGCIGVDFLFDIRGVFLTLKMEKNQHTYYKKEIGFPDSFHDFEDNGSYITYQHFVRPYFRVTLTYDPKSNDYFDLRFHMLRL